ncbi:hypothetical protein FHS56_000441 [Thermonema lapsum]|uniref:Uncharacterized protein n=1 Tax=Thermonema lapsum TaxID=28195 RepID=A0A846MND0_9BACT|nr:hypothetical protein [Thermonema lapsum]
MITVQGMVTLVTAYLFWRVLTTPPKPNAIEENNDDSR